MNMTVENRIRSRILETEIYTNAMTEFYSQANTSLQDLYDLAFELTFGFRSNFREAVLEDSRIIKILRYAIAPSISQMKFGQFVGLNSVDKFEAAALTEGAMYDRLLNSAEAIAEYLKDRIDKQRFIWLNSEKINDDQLAVAQIFAKRWTCSLIAHQNADTMFRNWRKDKQESSIKQFLIDAGLSIGTFRGVLERSSDIEPDHFVPETRVKGRTRQKADVVVRANNGKLLLIEAKAVGVEIDATKRVKECCDKASDWGSSSALNSPIVVAVIAGFFTQSNIDSLSSSGVKVIWEHDLEKLGDYL